MPQICGRLASIIAAEDNALANLTKLRLIPRQMSSIIRVSLFLATLSLVTCVCAGQGLSPRAYVVTPTHTNAFTLTYTYKNGDVVFDPSLPISDSSGTINNPTATLFHSAGLFGRSSNVSISLPYAFAHFEGKVLGVEEKLYRSGLAPIVVRVSVNIFGAPAMTAREMSEWRQKMNIGVSLLVNTATGQYDPQRLINVGNNRWAFKPEVGLSKCWGSWILDGYAAVWFFTPNNDFFSKDPESPRPNRQAQAPMGATELHLSYSVKPRMWFSLDGNYWYGGTTSLNGVPTPTTLQANSRIGATASIPVSKHQSLKASYSRGSYVRFGGNYQDLSIAWQYSWIGRPK